MVSKRRKLLSPDQLSPSLKPNAEFKSDLPPWLLSLARQMARDCARPGTYHITLTVPPHGREPIPATIYLCEALSRRTYRRARRVSDVG